MKAHHKIQAHKRTLFLMLLLIGALAVAGGTFAAIGGSRNHPGEHLRSRLLERHALRTWTTPATS